MSNNLSDTTEDIAVGTTEIENLESELQGHDSWFQTLSRAEKRFHILFYALAGLTGLLVVQLVWQIASITAR